MNKDSVLVASEYGRGRLLEDNHRLSEELAQCKADKEFVWSLWKQLQKESPDITTAVDMVVTRERLKQEQRDKEVALLLLAKDEQIRALQKVTDESCRLKENVEHLTRDKQQEELDSRTHERNKMAKEISAMALRIKTLEAELSHSKSRISSLTSAFSVDSEKSHSLQEELTKKSELVSELTEEHHKDEAIIKQLRDELKEVNTACDALATHSTVQTTLIQKLHNEIGQLKTRTVLPDMKSVELVGPHEESLVVEDSDNCEVSRLSKLLEQTERELFEMKTQLRAKSEELQCLRCSHDKRLERMKVLKTNHKLALEQIKTYETQRSPFGQTHGKKKPIKRRRHSESGLKHEDSKHVWNELSEYKSLCQEMEKELLLLEEERDTLQAKCCRNQTTISELRACLQHEKDDIERKITAIAALEGSVSSFNIQENKVIELEDQVEDLEEEKKQLVERCSDLEKQCAVFRQERVSLESTIVQMKHESKVKKLRGLCKATMTETFEELQPPPSKSTTSFKTVKPVQDYKTTSKSLQSRDTAAVDSDMKIKVDRGLKTKFSNKATCHRRSYSDGDTLLQDSERLDESPGFPFLKGNCTLTATTQRQASSNLHKCVTVLKNPVKNTSVSRCHLRSSSTQTEGKASSGVHRCGFQEKVKKLEQRLQLTLKKLASEGISRKSVVVSLKEQSALAEKYRVENREQSQKIQGYRVSLKAAECDKLKATESVKKLEERVQHLESSKISGRTDVQWRKIEKDKKELQDKCTELRTSTQSLQQELQIRDADLTQSQATCEKMERDLKQKRQLIEEYQKKLRVAQDVQSTSDRKILSLTEEVERMSKVSGQDRNKSQLLRSRLAQQSSDKDKLVVLLEKCQDELERTIQQLCACREQSEKRLKAASDSFHRLAKELKCANRETVSSLEVELQEKSEIVNEFKEAIQNLACELEKTFIKPPQEAALDKKQSDGLSTRVREIARSALQLSDQDIDELFCADRDKEEVSEVEAVNDSSGSTLLKTILMATTIFKPPFAKELTSQLMTFILQIKT